MGTSTLRQIAPERLPASTYWRRRFVTLVLGLSVLAIIAWAFSGSLGGSSAAAAGTGAKHAHHTGPGTGSASRGGTGPHNETGTDSPAASGHSQTPSTRAGAASSSIGAVLPCPAGAVVLSLFSTQASYSVREPPQFEVDVVSTAPAACTFDIGSRHVLVTISSGSARIWNSGDCTAAAASQVTELQRGVPTIVQIGWNGKHATPGCPLAEAHRRSYTAVASDGPARSNSVVFRIG